jgi:hypothetical protein
MARTTQGRTVRSLSYDLWSYDLDDDPEVWAVLVKSANAARDLEVMFKGPIPFEAIVQ